MTTHSAAGGFSVVVSPQGCVTVAGEVDLATAPELEAAIESAAQRGQSAVVVDLSQVNFMDSSGMNVFVRCFKRLSSQGCELVVRGSQPTVRRALEVGGVTTFLTVE